MQTKNYLIKIVSGGQTGADRAALDTAIKMGCSYGGWLPQGRKAEDGPLPDSYVMQEMDSGGYRKRTRQNVIDSDGTLIVSHGKLTGGSLLTQQLARKEHRPCLHIDCNELSPASAVLCTKEWLKENSICILNVAGPRASGDPLIYQAVKHLLTELLNSPAQ